MTTAIIYASVHHKNTEKLITAAGITGGLNGVYATDSNGIALNGRTFNANGIRTMTGLAGGLTTNAVSLAMGGDATFNLASAYGVGFLEFSIGKSGVHSTIGMGGTNISYQNLKAAYGGLSEAKKVSDWKYNMGEEQKRTLNAINMLGYTDAGNNQQLASEIWNDTKTVEYRNLDGEYGHFNNKEDPNKVIFSAALLGKGKEASAMLATVMSHEGTHVYGNRIEGKAHASGFSTYGQLMDQFGIKGNDTMLDSMMDAYFDKNSWIENSGDTDFWKLTKKADGTYRWAEDGSLDFNISRSDLEELARKDIKEAILLLGSAGSNFYNGRADTFKLASSENMTIDVAYKLAGLLGIKDTSYKGIPWESPQYEYDMEQLDFARNTLLFADASNAAKKAITSINGNNPKEKEINTYLTQMKSSLYAAQNSGLLVKTPQLQLAANNLIGGGTSDNPYFPLVPFSDGTIKITGKAGYRIVDLEMYEKVGKNGKNPNYPLYEFATIYHDGYDGIGSGPIVASENGSLSLTYSDAFGLLSNLQGEENSYQMAHGSTNTIMNYFAQFGSSGTSMVFENGQYSISGILAGTQIATMGQTGYATGNHSHMTVNGSGKEFGNVFYSNNYSSYEDLRNITKYDSYAEYMTGYTNTSYFDNDLLWSNVYKYSVSNDGKKWLNYNDYYNQHYIEKFYNFSGK